MLTEKAGWLVAKRHHSQLGLNLLATKLLHQKNKHGSQEDVLLTRLKLDPKDMSDRKARQD